MRRLISTVLVALNAADVHRLPFISTVVNEAVQRNMGVIAHEDVLAKAPAYRLTNAESLGYVWSIPGVSLASSLRDAGGSGRERRPRADVSGVPREKCASWKRARSGSIAHRLFQDVGSVLV